MDHHIIKNNIMFLRRAIGQGQLKFGIATNKQKVVMFPGNGIGPEISHSV